MNIEVKDMAAGNGDIETASIIKEAAEKLTGATPGSVEVSGIMPEAPEIDLTNVELAAPAGLGVVSTSPGMSVKTVSRAIVTGMAAGATAKVIGDALPDDTHWGLRLGATVTGGVFAATAAGAAFDAIAGWFGKDTE